MNTVRIPISKRAVERFRQLPKQQQSVLRGKAAALLEQEINQFSANDVNLADFQDAMDMTDEDMRLTFGQDYLAQRNWQPRSV